MSNLEMLDGKLRELEERNSRLEEALHEMAKQCCELRSENSRLSVKLCGSQNTSECLKKAAEMHKENSEFFCESFVNSQKMLHSILDEASNNIVDQCQPKEIKKVISEDEFRKLMSQQNGEYHGLSHS